MQRRAAMVVGLIDVCTAVHQLHDHRLQAHVAGHMERCVSRSIGLISLRSREEMTVLKPCLAAQDIVDKIMGQLILFCKTRQMPTNTHQTL